MTRSCGGRGGGGGWDTIILFMRKPTHSVARDKLQILKLPKEIAELKGRKQGCKKSFYIRIHDLTHMKLLGQTICNKFKIYQFSF